MRCFIQFLHWHLNFVFTILLESAFRGEYKLLLLLLIDYTHRIYKKKITRKKTAANDFFFLLSNRASENTYDFKKYVLRE